MKQWYALYVFLNSHGYKCSFIIMICRITSQTNDQYMRCSFGFICAYDYHCIIIVIFLCRFTWSEMTIIREGDQLWDNGQWWILEIDQTWISRGYPLPSWASRCMCLSFRKIKEPGPEPGTFSIQRSRYTRIGIPIMKIRPTYSGPKTVLSLKWGILIHGKTSFIYLHKAMYIAPWYWEGAQAPGSGTWWHAYRVTLHAMTVASHEHHGVSNHWKLHRFSTACSGEHTRKKIKSPQHYWDVIMGTAASQITSLTIVYSTVYSDADQRSKFRVTGLCAGNSPGTDGFPAQMASNVENVSIWWRHHDTDTAFVI